MLCVADCVRDRIRLAVPEPTECLRQTLSFRSASRVTANPDLRRLLKPASLIANSAWHFLNVALVLGGSFSDSSYKSCVIGVVPDAAANSVLRYNSAANASKTRPESAKSPISLLWMLARLWAFRAFAPLLNASAHSQSDFALAGLKSPWIHFINALGAAH
jgi:hypothetical protein